jgi:hypothetical protein
MRRVLAVTAVAATVLGLGVVLATDADASITAPANNATVHGTITLTESPGGGQEGYCHTFGSNGSTDLYLEGTSFHEHNGGGTLNASLRTEDYPNGTYTVHGVETYKYRAHWYSVTCSTRTSDYYSTIRISNAKTVTYTGASQAQLGSTATVSAKVVDPNDGNKALSGQSVTFALSGGSSVTANTNSSGIATATLPVNAPARAATISVSTPNTSYFTGDTDSKTFTVQKADSSVTVTKPDTVVHGQATSFTATVGHLSGVPATGSVQFVVDGADFGDPVPLSGDTAQSGSTSTLSTGDHAITAVYSGDGNYLKSTSSAVTQTVAKASTTTSLDSSLNPSTYGEATTFTARVAVVAPGVGSPTGAVQFNVDGQPYGTAVPLTGDTATLTVSSLDGGNHDVTATYSSDADFDTSTSPDLVQGVNVRPTSVTINSSSEPSVTGQPVTFTVDVASVPANIGNPTGTVQFSVDGDDLGSPVSLSAGSATSPAISDLAPGKHVVLAVYSGDSNFSGQQSSFIEHVNRAATTTSVSSAPNPSVFGQGVAFIASVSVSAPGAGTPTGYVQFYVDGVASGTPVELDGTTATSATVSDLSTGDHTVTAEYLGSDAFADSTSDAITQTVNPALTSTSLQSSANPSVFGQPVTLTATVAAVAPGAGNPAGTITFTDGATTLGSVDVGPDTGEQASVTVDSLAVGPHAITASYSGSGDFKASSDVATQSVHKAQTATVLTSSANPSKSGQAVRFTAQVTPVAPGAGNPTGTVSFTVNGAPIGSPAPVTDGVATSAAFTSLTPGTYDIEATYSGDGSFAASSAGLDEGNGQTVDQAATTLDLTSTPNPAAFGQTVSFTATVTAQAPATGTPTGVVDFFDGQELLGAASLVAGDAGTATAQFAWSSLGAGTHAISAQYVGNFNFAGATASVSQVVGAQPTVTGLVTSPNPVTYGDAVTLTATVAAGSGTPTGTVTFLDGSTVLGTADLADVNRTQQATLTVPRFEAGAHQLTASYDGNATFAASTSPTVTENVHRAQPALAVTPYFSRLNNNDPTTLLISTELTAVLTGVGGEVLPGQTLVFQTTPKVGDWPIGMCTVVTDSNGVAACDGTFAFPLTVLDNGFDVRFAGSVDYLPLSVHMRIGYLPEP